MADTGMHSQQKKSISQYAQYHGYCIDESELSFVAQFLPELFDTKFHDEVEIAHMLHLELHELLHSFVGGGFSTAGYALYPLLSDVSEQNTQRAGRIIRLFMALNVQFPYHAPKKSAAMAQFIAQAYRHFSSLTHLKTKESAKPSKIEACPIFSLQDYSTSEHEYLKPIEHFAHFLSPIKAHLLGAYLHGSLATNDYVRGWSDCDALVILSKEATSSPKALLECRKRLYLSRQFFYGIDPLQHHGPIILSEHDFASYPQAFFPLPLFSYAKSLLPHSKQLTIHVRESRQETLAKLFYIVSYMRRAQTEKKMGRFEEKNFLHLLALFPSLYLQSKGIWLYKKFSFEKIKSEFSQSQYEPLAHFTSLRSSWKAHAPLPFTKTLAKRSPALAYHLSGTLQGMLSPAPLINETLKKSAHELIEEAWKRVKSAP